MEPVAPRPTPVAIRMRDVAVGSLQDPTATLLSGVNWEVHSGEFWAVAGLQGEGKSDLLMLTAGLMPPLEGEYWLFDEPMPMFDEARLPQRLRLGLAFEGGQLFNHLTVSENLALPLRYHRNLSKAEAAPVVQKMLERLDLAAWADSTPGALGRNWHKRVGAARALMLQPEILLLDNPLAGLDLRHISWWLRFLEQLSQPGNFVRPEKMTLVVTTADLRPWIGLATHFATIKNKGMTVVGSRAQLEALANELTQEFLAPGTAQ